MCGLRWRSAGTTHVPIARQTTIGAASASAADGASDAVREAIAESGLADEIALGDLAAV